VNHALLVYRRRATPLHAARASVGGAYCLALGLIALVYEHPAVLIAVLVAVLGAGTLAGVGASLRRAFLIGLPFALLVAVINPLVTSRGLTVIARLGTLPVRGRLDVTLEATAYGGVLGLRALVLILCFALYSVAVDPDEVLRLFRRVSFRSALTATLATRLVPVLARDAGRIAEAQRCRPAERPPGRVALVRAVASGALDRAVNVAAALEVRGYGAARRGPRGHSRPLSRHDLAFGLAALVLLGVSLARAFGAASFGAYPSLRAPLDVDVLVVCVLILLAAWLPFGQRRGVT
jgi:energy-coupling factor transport system permease protein